jgi:hypothetical protein
MLQFACEPFITVDDLDCPCELGATDVAAVIDSVSDFLCIQSGGVMTGRCESVVRPCSLTCSCGAEACGGCGCCVLDVITLHGPRPVVSRVTIDGVVLAPASYGLVDGVKLMRYASSGPPRRWPGSQHLYRPVTEPGTFAITYEHGMEIDFIAQRAAIEVVCSLLAEINHGEDLLDPRTVSARLDGLTLEFAGAPGTVGVEGNDRGFVWLNRYMKTYVPSGVPQAVWSVELNDGWELHTVAH